MEKQYPERKNKSGVSERDWKAGRILRGVLTALAISSILAGCNGSGENKESATGTSAEGSRQEGENTLTEEVEKELETMKIVTPYCELEYPAQWKEYLEYEEDTGEDRVSKTFYYRAGDQKIRLFSVHLGGSGMGDLIGWIEEKERSVRVYVEMSDLELDDTLTEEEQTIVYAMAEGINDTIGGLKKQGKFIPLESVSANSGEQKEGFLAIETPYCTLEYPSRWEEYLSYEEQKDKETYVLVFYCNMGEKKIELFSVYFGNPNEGDLLGYIMKDGTKRAFSVKAAALTDESAWTEEEADIIYAMGESINDVVASVSSSQYFTYE